MLKEKFKATGLLPVKFVFKKPSHKGGYRKKSIKFNETGKTTPINLTILVEKSNLNFRFPWLYFNTIKNGIRNNAVGLIIMLIPRITLPISCHLSSSYLRNI